ncbi:sulfotransferase domain-containing protein [Myxococcus eversor]|uniref:sulfotransferase domain-containing protein n=1 Tax=Myxococcus eversor TaxID=2709661 RepID=UPI0013D57DD2|nr:sulfotransferase domain-containing protein [Myxococcus eversor]
MPISRPWLRFLLRQSLLGLTWLSRWLLVTAERLRWVRLRYVWLKPRAGDIYIAASPKAGTTWMQMIVFQLATQGRGEFEHISQVSPFLEMLPRDATREPLLDAPEPVNAADSLGSLYHHHCLLEEAPIDFGSFFRVVMDEDDPWLRHLESWWPHHRDRNVLHLRYEDLTQDLEASVRRVAAFCGLPLD